LILEAKLKGNDNENEIKIALYYFILIKFSISFSKVGLKNKFFAK